jgi:hypothetical protein
MIVYNFGTSDICDENTIYKNIISVHNKYMLDDHEYYASPNFNFDLLFYNKMILPGLI